MAGTMSRNLFRREAIDFQRDRMVGEVIIRQPISSLVLFITFSAIAVAFIFYVAMSSYTRKERVQGYLVPASGLVEVYSERPATIVKVSVENGQFVKKGDPLISLESEESMNSRSDVDDSVVQGYESQIKSLNEQLEQIDINLNRRRNFLKISIENLQLQIVRLEKRKTIQTERLDIVEKRSVSLEPLRKNAMISEDERSRFYDRVLSERMNEEELSQTILQRKLTLEENTFNLTQMDFEASTQKNEIKRMIVEIEHKILQQRLSQRFIITAPVEGRVSSLQAYTGLRLSPQQVALAILPENSKLEVELLIPSRAIGFIEPGQAVEIRYDAFPHEKFGSHSGRILKVSKTAFMPNQITAPLLVNEPIYKARIGLDRDSVPAFGREYPLQVGMSVQADVLLDKRPLYQWIFKPLYSIYGKI